MDRQNDALTSSEKCLLVLLIDEQFYNSQTPVQFVNSDHLVDHYLLVGWRKGYRPSPTFRPARYINATFGLSDSGGNPYIHYLFEKVGEARLESTFSGLDRDSIRTLRENFDAGWYLHQYPDVEVEGDDPFIHYMASGWKDGRQPSRGFCVEAYLERNSDIREGGINPFAHWVLHGRAEGRAGGEPAPLRLGGWNGLSSSEQAILSRIFEVETYYRPFVALGKEPGAETAQAISAGQAIGSLVTASFRPEKYLAANPELIEAEQVPILHFLFGRIGDQHLRELFFSLSPLDIERLCEHFDAPWYLYSYPDIEAEGGDAFIHYMTTGWRAGRDPSSEFSTSAYLLRYPDIAKAEINPFQHWVMHGKSEGRSGASASSNFRTRPYFPSITAILVNTNNDPVRPDCLSSVLDQSYENLSIIVIGNPLAAIEPMSETKERRIKSSRVVPSLGDAGVQQLERVQRALDQAQGDLVWFIEGGNGYEVDYIARLATSFADGSVQIGFGRLLELRDYDPLANGPSRLSKSGWNKHVTMPSAMWFARTLATDGLAMTDEGFVWRRRTLAGEAWRKAMETPGFGIWHLLLHMASGGQIATVRDALARRLEPVRAVGGTGWPPLPMGPEGAVARTRLEAEIWSTWPMKPEGRAEYPTPPDPRSTKGSHILIVTHGIFAGGAENFPIQLANDLVDRGIIVSMLIFKIDDVNPQMRATLDPGISIYEAEWVLEYGCDRFVQDIGCTLIHSHGIVGETFFFNRCQCQIPVPYVATLHGSYEASNKKYLPEKLLAKIVRRVDLFIYTADKNLAPLLRHGVQPDRLLKLSNAMPVDEMPFPQSRRDLGIAEDAVVFTLVARGIKEKGWSIAIKAFNEVRSRNPDRAMHLCLVGEGDEPDRLKRDHGDDTAISFLGYQLRIHGLYRMTDVAIVPTRFAGESFPLCIIQALQVSCPVIATDVGEISSMVEGAGQPCGIIVEPSRIDKVFQASFADAMDEMMDDKRRKSLAAQAGIAGHSYDMSALTDRYVEIYGEVTRTFAKTQMPTMQGSQHAEPIVAE